LDNFAKKLIYTAHIALIASQTFQLSSNRLSDRQMHCAVADGKTVPDGKTDKGEHPRE
jgi:hypothetical protein